MNKADVDYAYFRKDFARDYDKPKQKIETINKLISNFPKSAYIVRHFLNLGTYAQLDL